MHRTRNRRHEGVLQRPFPALVGNRHRNLLVEPGKIVPQQRTDHERQSQLRFFLRHADQRHCRRSHEGVKVKNDDPADVTTRDMPPAKQEGPRLSQCCFHDQSSTIAISSSSTSSSPVKRMKASSSVAAFARCINCLAVPSATSLPCARKPMRAHSLSASAMSCVVNRIVVPSRDCRSSRNNCTSRRLFGSSPVVGSSSNNNGGLTISARAMLIFCCIPRLISSSGVENFVSSIPNCSRI